MNRAEAGIDARAAGHASSGGPVQSGDGFVHASHSVRPWASRRFASPPQLPRMRRLLTITPIAIAATAIKKAAVASARVSHMETGLCEAFGAFALF